VDEERIIFFRWVKEIAVEFDGIELFFVELIEYFLINLLVY